jgi:hypothetical protein
MANESIVRHLEAEHEDVLVALVHQLQWSQRLQYPEHFANDNDFAWPLLPFPDGWTLGE